MTHRGKIKNAPFTFALDIILSLGKAVAIILAFMAGVWAGLVSYGSFYLTDMFTERWITIGASILIGLLTWMIAAIPMLAWMELLELFISIEANTRKTAYHLDNIETILKRRP